LRRYERLKQMQDTIFATGSDSLGSTLATNYGLKAGKGKEQFLTSVNERLRKDPTFKEKLAKAYANVSKPNPQDYFNNEKYDEVVSKRINSQDAITNLLFAGGKGPNMLTTEQLKAQEADLLKRGGTGSRDFTGGLTEELSKLQLGGKAPEPEKDLGGKTIVETFIKHKLAGADVPSWLQKAWDADAEKKGTHQVKSTVTHADGSTEDFYSTVKVDSAGKIDILDKKSLGQAKQPSPAPVPDSQVLKRSLSFLNSKAQKEDNKILTKMMNSGDDAVLSSLQEFRTSLADRVVQLRKESEWRGKDFNEVMDEAYKELKPGLNEKEGVPEWSKNLLPQDVQDFFKKPAFDKPGSAPTVSTQEEYDALPSGSMYIEPDGKKYRKP